MTEDAKRELAAKIKSEQMYLPLCFKPHEIHIEAKNDNVDVFMKDEEDRKRKHIAPHITTALRSEWIEFFASHPKLVAHLSKCSGFVEAFFYPLIDTYSPKSTTCMATYQINGTTFNEGDPLIISTPELGTIEVRGTIRGFTRDNIVGLSFGYVKTPLPCRSDTQRDNVNARMELYTNGRYVKIGVFYCCPCKLNVHNHALEWLDLTIEGNRITANGIGEFMSMEHNHALVDGYQHLTPRPGRVETPPPPLPAPVVKVKPPEESKPATKPAPAVVFEPTKPASKPKAPEQGQLSFF